MAVEVRGYGDSRMPQYLLDVVQVGPAIGTQESGCPVPEVVHPLVADPGLLSQGGELPVEVARLNGLAGRGGEDQPLVRIPADWDNLSPDATRNAISDKREMDEATVTTLGFSTRDVATLPRNTALSLLNGDAKGHPPRVVPLAGPYQRPRLHVFEQGVLLTVIFVARYL